MAPRLPVIRELSEPDLTVLPGIKATFIMPSPSIPSGGEDWAELEIANVSEAEIAFQTDDLLIATFVLPGTRSVVGAFGGAIAGVGLHVRLAPHATRLIPVIVGAWGHVSRERDPRTSNTFTTIWSQAATAFLFASLATAKRTDINDRSFGRMRFRFW